MKCENCGKDAKCDPPRCLTCRRFCNYWCPRCGGSGTVPATWRDEEDYQCGACNGSGHGQPSCTCGHCSAWFHGRIDIDLIHELERIAREHGTEVER